MGPMTVRIYELPDQSTVPDIHGSFPARMCGRIRLQYYSCVRAVLKVSVFVAMARSILLFAAVALVFGCAASQLPPSQKTMSKAAVQVQNPQGKKQGNRSVASKAEKKAERKTVDKSRLHDRESHPERPEPAGAEQGHGAGGRLFYYYDYYPDPEVYFDTVRHLYFYRDKGVWTMSVALPAAFQENLGEKVRLKMETDSPFADHDVHREKYPSGGEYRGF